MDLYISDLIKLALRSIGVAALSDQITPDQSREAIIILNQIRKERSISTIRNPVPYDEMYFTSANAQYITMGTSPTLSGNILKRPSLIDEIIILNGLPNGNFNLSIPIQPFADYRKLMVQSIFAIPQTAYVDTNYPIQKIYLYPGLATGYGIRVVGSSYSTDYESLTDLIVDPPEVIEVLRLGLALRLAPLYGVTDIMDLVKQMSSADKHYKSMMFNRTWNSKQFNPMAANGGSNVNFWSGI